MSDPFTVERILCPTDFSVFSARAFRHAVSLARKFGAALKVVHVIPLVGPYPGPAFYPVPLAVDPETRARAEAEMKAFVAPATEARVAVETEVREGEAWREIVAIARELPADLVVLGTHGRGGLERLFLGSVAEKLLRRLVCPVLTVCHEEGRTWEAPGLVRRILCATDLRESSPEIQATLSLAARYQARVTLLHVIEEMPLLVDPAYMGEAESHRLVVEKQRVEALHQAVRRAEAARGVEIEERVVWGRAYREVLARAATEAADLVVLGPGKSTLDHLFMGSNAQHVVREATCPVLTLCGQPVSRVRPRTAAAPMVAKAR